MPAAVLAAGAASGAAAPFTACSTRLPRPARVDRLLTGITHFIPAILGVDEASGSGAAGGDGVARRERRAHVTRTVATGELLTRADGDPPLGGAWTAVFPATYGVHLMEEYWCGESFYRWVSRVADVAFTRRDFLVLNLTAFTIMSFGAWLATRHTRMQWLVATLGVVVAFNGFLHLVASLATWSYSPGLVSGLGLWVPTGALSLRRASRQLPRRHFAGAVALGAVAHGVVSLLVLTR